MSLFSAAARSALNVLASTYGDAGTFTTQDGPAVPVTVIGAAVMDVPADIFETRARNPAVRVLLRYEEIATRPTEGDSLTIATGPHAGPHAVLGAEADGEGIGWYVDVQP